MFDIGWSELLLIGIVALIVVGPKELPGLFRTVGSYMGKARAMAREFQRSMEQAADESGLNEAAGSLKSLNRLNLNSATASARRYAESAVKGAVKPATDETAVPPAGEPAEAPAGPAAAEAPAAAPPARKSATQADRKPAARKAAAAPAAAPAAATPAADGAPKP